VDAGHDVVVTWVVPQEVEHFPDDLKSRCRMEHVDVLSENGLTDLVAAQPDGVWALVHLVGGYLDGTPVAGMPMDTWDRQFALNNHGKAVKSSRVHIVGVAYKRNIDDMRESPALDVILLLKKLGAEVSYSDPYVPTLKLDGMDLKSQEAQASAHAADCVVIITDHSDFDYKALLDSSKLIVDTRNAMRGIESEKIVRL